MVQIHVHRTTSAVTTSLMQQRAKLSSWNIYIILLLLGFTAALSCFYVVPPRVSPQRAHLPGVQIQDKGQSTASQTTLGSHSQQAAAAAAAARQAAAGGQPSGPAGPCHVEPHSEYGGDVVVWGDQHIKASPADCCAACQATQEKGCNVWVFCDNKTGCSDRKHGECWLKRQKDMNILQPMGYRHESVNWTSGALFDDARRERLLAAEAQRLATLRDDPELPLVYFDVSIKGVPQGRITMVLFTKEAPRAAENFRQLCTGERGMASASQEGASMPYHFKGAPFYRIIDQFIDQAGINTDSVFGGQFKDDPGGLALKHDRKGLLSMANTGPNTNTAHFSIMMGPAPHLNTKYTIFGEVVNGIQVVNAINALSKTKPDKTATAADGAVITDSGQLRRGSHKPNLQQM